MTLHHHPTVIRREDYRPHDATGKAQRAWALRPIADRLGVIRRFRRATAEDPDPLLRSLADRPNREPVDSLLAEILPLVDACRFLEREGRSILAPRRLGWRGRPLWLTGNRAEIRREPWGTVLIVGPSNYPLLLTALPALQALAAGNAVLIKPAPGCEAAAGAFAGLMDRAGLPAGLCRALGSKVADVEAAVAAGVDHVVLTGSAATGRAVLSRLAPHLVPATMELSGNDALFVLPGADLRMVAGAVAYGLSLNGSATCIAPRRIFVRRDEAPVLEDHLGKRLSGGRPLDVPEAVGRRVLAMLDEARAGGARLIPGHPIGSDGRWRPTVVADASPAWQLLREDVFAPLASIVAVDDLEEALTLDERCPYGLGASVFGPEAEARSFAGRIDAGSVTVNDVIVPTADPRLPFGGRRESGFGVTRGAEGLLQMTTVKTVAVRPGRFRPYYDPLPEGAEAIARQWLALTSGEGVARRLRALGSLIGQLPRLSRRNSAS